MPALMPAIVARACAHGGRAAIRDRNSTYTYTDLDRASAQIAANLLDGRDDLKEARVAFAVTPGFEYVATLWGIWRAGGIAVPLPILHPAAELDYLVRDSEASVVIADADNALHIEPLAHSAGAGFYLCEHLIALTTGADRESGPTSRATEMAGTRRALIVYTSGTTGRPKGVVTTHGNVTAQIQSLITAWEWTDDDRTLLVLPLHHVHGILNVVSSALWSGALLEMMPRFECESTWERLASGELTVFSAVPTIYHRLIKSWELAGSAIQEARSSGCGKLRLMMSGSAALPRTTLDRWKEITGHTLLERYGMTEVGMALANPLRGERRPGSVGVPLPGVAARLADGELQLKGPGVFSEYWRQPDESRAAFTDGWFRTGDAAVLEDGAFRLLGRSSVDILKVGGHKISALEIEEVLRAHPAIAECVVVGVEDPEWGQRVCCAAEIRSENGLELEDLKAWARSRLAPYKIPRELACVSQLPRNAMGKVVKPEVARLFVRPAPPEHPAF